MSERVRVGEDEGRRALLVDGVVQSVDVEVAPGGYWTALLPSVRPRRALVLGLGGGTVVHLLRRRFGELSVVGVDDDPAVIALARTAFGLEQPGLEIVQADAFAYVAEASGPFDYICVDLYHGAQLARGVLARPFLRRLKELAGPGGELVFNLFLDRRITQSAQRIGRVLGVQDTQRVGKNVVVWASARATPPGRR